MKKIVELKHWQVFAIILLPVFNPGINFVVDGILGSLSFTFFFFWILSIGLVLNDLLPNSKKVNSNYFQISAGFIIIYFVYIIFVAGGGYYINNHNYKEYGLWIWLIIPLHLYLMWSIFYMFHYAAKIISRLNIFVNKKKDSTTAGYFFGFWFYLIGIWIIQPKIHELLNKSSDGQ